MKRIARSVVPTLDTWEESERFHHRDLADREPASLWAEGRLLEERLAQIEWGGEREHIITCTSNGCVTERGWIIERLAKIRSARRSAA